MKNLITVLIGLLMLVPDPISAQSIQLELGVGVGQYESDLADQEKELVDSFGLYKIFYHDETGEERQIPLDYSYTPKKASVGLVYYPNDKYGLGVMYKFLEIEQRYDFPTEFSTFETSESFSKAHTIGPMLNYFPLKLGIVKIGLFAHGFRQWGELTRAPVLETDYTENDELGSFIHILHRKIDIKGWGYSIGPKFELSNRDYLNSWIKLTYDYSKLDLIDDPFPGYIKNSTSVEYVFTAGLSLIIER